MKKFWAVVRSSQRPMQFTFRHDSFESAVREAKRLADANRPAAFYIVEFVGHVAVPNQPVEFVPAEPSDDQIRRANDSIAMARHISSVVTTSERLIDPSGDPATVPDHPAHVIPCLETNDEPEFYADVPSRGTCDGDDVCF